MITTINHFQPTPPRLRYISATVLALAVTFTLFAAMQQLIKTRAIARVDPVAHNPVELYNPPNETDPIKRQPPPVMPPQQPIPEMPRIVDPTPNIMPGPIALTKVEIPTQGGPNPNWSQADRGATPLVRVEPRYPTEAARDGISGWVQLAFTIDTTGAVIDVRVIAAEPARVFDREAIKALRRWKYQPKLVEGVAVLQPNMQVQLDFNLQAD
ncbi:MAG: energy transducer TonB [Chromatiaceae bacterium]|nr:energy transducer TonB [Chromatiaceae bacterium]